MTAGTALILAEHVEKTAASIILRHVHAAIKETLKQRKIPNNDTESLTPQDHFYREISRIEEIVNGFQIVSEKATSGSWSPRDVVYAVNSINTVILTMLKEVLKIRVSKKRRI